MESKFEFKVGDRVEFGGVEGVVTEVDRLGFTYPVVVKLDGDHDGLTFTPDGRLYDWNTKPLLNLIARPKRKVTKTIKRWTNVYPVGPSGYYESKERADMFANPSRIACVELTGTYEVEE